MRTHSPQKHCSVCGQVTVMLVFDESLDEDGEPFRAIFRDVIRHTAKECVEFQALCREQWPALW
jgi:hypothetical protein